MRPGPQGSHEFQFRSGSKFGSNAEDGVIPAPSHFHDPSGYLFLMGADEETRTPNLLFTKQLLCQLSYVGMNGTRSKE
jgi:hypothetical protein